MEAVTDPTGPRAFTPTALPPIPHLAFDALAQRSYDELEVMYRAASAPASLRAADGRLVGRMLAMKHADRGPVARWLRRRALSPRFVWEGKTFAATSDRLGTGHNRICVEGVIGRQPLFPFESRIERSRFDGRPTIVIDYDRSVNPWFMRRIHDEIRELGPGLFLGLDMWKAARGSVGVVWFALATDGSL